MEETHCRNEKTPMPKELTRETYQFRIHRGSEKYIVNHIGYLNYLLTSCRDDDASGVFGGPDHSANP